MVKTKREQIRVACEQCRKSKSKCSGERPVCSRCSRRDIQCLYSADADASPKVVLKRKYDALSEAYAERGREILLLRKQYDVDTPGEPSLARESSASNSLLSDKHCDQSEESSSAVPTSSAVLSLPTPSPPVAVEGQIGERATKILRAFALKSDQEITSLLARIRSGEEGHTIAEDLLFEQEYSLRDPQNRQDAYSTPITPGEAKPNVQSWLPALFDRQYFLQVSRMPCFPAPYTAPTLPSSENRFGNFSFASAIAANHYPLHIQHMQQRNMYIPTWAKVVLNGVTRTADPFETAFAEMVHDISTGIPPEELCGPHVYLAALDNNEVCQRAPKLSQFVARAVRSIKATETSITFTQYAIMYWFWSLWRWMLMPTKQTYYDVPDFARPTPAQLLLPHPSVFDFILTPSLRNLMCQADTPNIQWFTEAAITIHCLWDGTASSALCRDGMTSEIDFNPRCKTYISEEQNWALGASVKPFLPNVDSFVQTK